MRYWTMKRFYSVKENSLYGKLYSFKYIPMKKTCLLFFRLWCPNGTVNLGNSPSQPIPLASTTCASKPTPHGFLYLQENGWWAMWKHKHKQLTSQMHYSFVISPSFGLMCRSCTWIFRRVNTQLTETLTKPKTTWRFWRTAWDTS